MAMAFGYNVGAGALRLVSSREYRRLRLLYRLSVRSPPINPRWVLLCIFSLVFDHLLIAWLHRYGFVSLRPSIPHY